ncbi:MULTISPECIES: hypothetical protein [unclassified Bradyrhizobium]|uniref:hypothetical protein n=1 Tax=unclassified Bradyrhizobium TaxID=2631580 RepID=UPI00247AC8B7|nr:MULTISPECIES: hypothetical protein [unclassified Bradyrhizobium]WGR95867.1 hypothetical protein MTX20_19640 [Bradyrhizobium sp. ISRA435]WGS01002.1 hypothetical protein MTX23_09330 [Bradyrhizobium sp. ISRA436]WGS07889.1 hypothetical protein MTX18_09335 [Bradyrhizobium sp. ISRA437]WGS14777.1 hypothetical protein MTX26_09335 [Bradyrhizobium sp. ISRA443]WGS29363.1 hypothetical protein MTX19_10180 [Bradyrhizobium sp. ISRA464]
MVRAGFFLFVIALTAPSLAVAETMSFGDAAAQLAKACGADITANCRGVNLDSNRLKECLSRNRDAISADCKATYFSTFDAIQKRIAARITVAGACRHEIVKVCGGSTKETSKSVACLVTAKGVSRNCAQAISDAGYQ